MAILLFLTWIILNGQMTWEVCLFGIVISGGIYLFAWKYLDWGPRRDLAILRKLPGLLHLLAVLFWEIWKANCTVLRFIYGRTAPKPRLVHYQVPLKSKSTRVALADCITLTPGTITGKLDEDGYTVHCLDESLTDSSTFVELLQKLEG